jgi:two-component system sensor histidine kinase YesM
MAALLSIRSSLFNKYIVAFISVGLLPVLFISSYSNYLFRKETYAMTEDNYRQAALYGAGNLDNIIEKYNTISKILYNYNTDRNTITRRTDRLGFADILKQPAASAAEQLNRYNEIIAFLHLIQISDAYLRNAVFVEADETCYTFSRNNRPLRNEQKFLEKMNHREPVKANQLKIIPAHRDDYFLGSNEMVFTVGRNYLDISYLPGVDKILGTLYLDISIRVIDDLFKQMDIYQKGNILIFDSLNNIIYTNPEYYKNSSQNNSSSSLELTEYCEKTGWRIVFRLDYQNVLHNIVNLIRLVYIITIGVFMALLFLSILYSKMFSNPIRAIITEMKKVEEGNFKVDIKIKAEDEIGQIAEGFLRMTNRLEEYIRTSLLAQIRRKEAEISSLKAKIKPHFLYNSLEIIRMNAVANDDESTAELALLLADQMRYSLGQIDEKVPLYRELEMIRNYFAFIDIRYNHKITLNIIVDQALNKAQVLSLMVQPIVENAVIHGLKPSGQGQVRITAERQNKDLAIRVMDNGVGMDETKVVELIGQLNRDDGIAGDDPGRNSLGLKNVHDRLRYIFGKSYGISINSAPQIGTSVTMLLPLILQGDIDV